MATTPTAQTQGQDDKASDPRSVIAALRQQLSERTEERDSGVAREAALAEVLDVINASPGDLEPVFDAILERAMRLCGAAFGELVVFDGQSWGIGAVRGVPPELTEFRRQHLAISEPATIRARILAGEDLILIADARDTDEYRAGYVSRRAMVDIGGARSVIAVALRHDGRLLGGLNCKIAPNCDPSLKVNQVTDIAV